MLVIYMNNGERGPGRRNFPPKEFIGRIYMLFERPPDWGSLLCRLRHIADASATDGDGANVHKKMRSRCPSRSMIPGATAPAAELTE